MKRTGEKVLSIIAHVLNVLAVGLLIVMLFGSRMFMDMTMNDPVLQSEFESQMSASGLTQAEMDDLVLYMDDFMSIISGVGWVFVILGLIALVLGIIGTIKLNKNAKLAGILFSISGVLSGIISLQGILLIIAAIMCFVRKPKTNIPLQKTDENGYVIE